MEENKNQSIFCKKIRYGNEESPTVILGIILNDVDGFIEIQTAKHKLTIAKNTILSISDTQQVFKGEE